MSSLISDVRGLVHGAQKLETQISDISSLSVISHLRLLAFYLFIYLF